MPNAKRLDLGETIEFIQELMEDHISNLDVHGLCDLFNSTLSDNGDWRLDFDGDTDTFKLQGPQTSETPSA